MESTRLKYLFKLALQHLVVGNKEEQYGICHLIHFIWIDGICTYDEKVFLMNYLFNNRPTKENEYKEFTENNYWTDTSFWWRPIFDIYSTKKIRIAYLTKLIDNIK